MALSTMSCPNVCKGASIIMAKARTSYVRAFFSMSAARKPGLWYLHNSHIESKNLTLYSCQKTKHQHLKKCFIARSAEKARMKSKS